MDIGDKFSKEALKQLEEGAAIDETCYWLADAAGDGPITGLSKQYFPDEIERALTAALESAGGALTVVEYREGGPLTPTEEDFLLLDHLKSRSIGYILIGAGASEMYALLEPGIKRRETTTNGPISAPLSEEDLGKIFGEDGALSSIIPGFQPRKSQRDLALFLEEGLTQNSVVIAEAETGVGKSLAYLVVAIRAAVESESPVIISTATLSLQSQLFEKDLPVALEALNLKREDVQPVVVRGRQNYLCLKHLAEQKEELFAGQKAKVISWAETTKSGDFSTADVPFSRTLQRELGCSPDDCIPNRCLHKKACFLFKMKRRAMQSHLIITNHHLFFADLALRQASESGEAIALLPNADCLVIDEAHQFSSVGLQFLSQTLCLRDFHPLCMKVVPANRRGGLYDVMARAGEDLPFSPSEGRKKLEENVGAIYDLFKKLERALVQKFPLIQPRETRFYGERLLPGMDRFTSATLSPILSEISERCAALGEVLPPLVTFLRQSNETKTDLESDAESLLAICVKAQAFTFRFLAEQEDHNTVFWARWGDGTNDLPFLKLFISPLNIGPLIKSLVLENYRSVFFLSATLAIGESFEYFKSSIGVESGLEDRPVLSRSFETEFDLRAFSPAFLVKDLPQPQAPAFRDSVASALVDALKASNGGALVLFTSYNMLTYCAEKLKESPGLRGQEILFQSQQSSKDQLLRSFRSQTSSSLLATSTFWQGVDIPGESLRLLVIVKLPFQAPGSPIYEGKSEKLLRENKNPFSDFSLPEAVLSFKQGIGRLIRSSNDRGAVLVLDCRTVTKGYGRAFQEALGDRRISYISGHQVGQELRSFYEEGA